MRNIWTNRGIKLEFIGGKFKLTTKREHAKYFEKLVYNEQETKLSESALQVLSIIAYNQPVTKAFVEQVRGVDCSGVVGSLTTRGLIEEKGRLELPGRPLLYGTTENFLRCFQLESLDDLPPLAQPEEETDKEQDNADENNHDAARPARWRQKFFLVPRIFPTLR